MLVPDPQGVRGANILADPENGSRRIVWRPGTSLFRVQRLTRELGLVETASWRDVDVITRYGTYGNRVLPTSTEAFTIAMSIFDEIHKEEANV